MSNPTKHHASEASAREGNGIGAQSVQPNEGPINGPSAVDELSGLLLKFHPPMLYEPSEDDSRGSSSSGPAHSSAGLGAHSHYNRPSARISPFGSNISIDTSIHPPMTCEATPVQSPVSLEPSAPFFAKRHLGHVHSETPAGAAACQQPPALHPPFVLPLESSPAGSAPSPHSSPESLATDICDTTADTAVDTEEDTALFDSERLREVLHAHRRLVNIERQAAIEKSGRIYRKVRLRRSQETQRSKHRKRDRDERAMTIDSYLVPPMDQRPPRYARRRTPDPEERIMARARRAKLKMYHSSAANVDSCGMAWSPTHSPVSG